MPQAILDCVVAVPVQETAGKVLASGPGDATVAGQQENEDLDTDAAKQSRYISAFSPEDIPGAQESSASLEVSSLMEQLEELDKTAQRSVAAEVESAIEGGACLVDDAGRERILELCKEIRNRAAKLSHPDKIHKLQAELQKTALGKQDWQKSGPKDFPDDSPPIPPLGPSTLPRLEVPRSATPLSLFDWRIWSQARPGLWRYGDAGNLDPKRTVPLLTQEWIACLCLREEMEYDLDTDTIPFKVREDPAEPEVNRFAGDWITLHLFASLFYLTERHQSAFAFLKNGGMKWAEKVRHLTPETLANSARLDVGAGGIQAIVSNKSVPQVVREALNAMQMAFADVVGTDGHRRLCRHEGVAYMALFGPPVTFCTPNLADTRQVMLLVVEGVEVRLDAAEMDAGVLPKYRDMMQRLAGDPVGQTLVFELLMRLFFIHVLGVRPECLRNRRRAKTAPPREWCTDGVAASSSAPGMFGPVLAFRGEVEAQGRGSLHPHILVWLVCMSSRLLLRLLQKEPDRMRRRLAQWMKACVASMESTCQSSVQALPRQFNDLDHRLDPLPFTKTECSLTRFDGGTELDTLREEHARGVEPTAAQQEFLETESESAWNRPKLHLSDEPKRGSIYGKRLDEFAASQCPSYRRHGLLTYGDTAEEANPPLSAAVWQQLLADDVMKLAREILVHICGESCFKYSGGKVQHICRHGYYYIVSLADFKCRRRGKPLRNALLVIKQTKFGMEGRLMQFQEHPFECQSNYVGLAAMRCNLDVQDLRRILPCDHWLDPEEELPDLGIYTPL